MLPNLFYKTPAKVVAHRFLKLCFFEEYSFFDGVVVLKRLSVCGAGSSSLHVKPYP